METKNVNIYLNVELLDTFKRQFFLLDENSNWVAHEVICHFHDISWHRCRKQNNLQCVFIF